MIIKSDHKEATILGKSEVTTGTIALNAETFGLIIKGIPNEYVVDRDGNVIEEIFF